LFGSRLNVVWQFVLHIPRDVARTVELVWQLPINIRAGPDLEFNWIKIANQNQQTADRYQIFVLHLTKL